MCWKYIIRTRQEYGDLTQKTVREKLGSHAAQKLQIREIFREGTF